MLNKVLTTNLTRSKFAPDISDHWTFCQVKQETLLHLLVECLYLEVLWKKLENDVVITIKWRFNLLHKW